MSDLLKDEDMMGIIFIQPIRHKFFWSLQTGKPATCSSRSNVTDSEDDDQDHFIDYA